MRVGWYLALAGFFLFLDAGAGEGVAFFVEHDGGVFAGNIAFYEALLLLVVALGL